MKLTTQRMFGLQTVCLRAFVVILGFAVALAIVSAHEKPSGEEDAKSAAKPAVVAKTPLDQGIAASKMPDISGTWRFTKEGSKIEVVMRRVEDGSADFAFGSDVEAVRVKWSDDAQRFEGTVVTTSPKIVSKITMQFLSDQQTLRVVTSLNEQAKQHILKSRPNLSDSQLVELMTQEWTRAEKPVGKAEVSADAITVSTTPSAAKPVADSKMPDISGTWSVRVAVPVNRSVEAGEMEIRRIQYGDTDFLIDQPWVTNPTRIPVKWSPARQQFEGTWWEDAGPQSKITMRFPVDNKPMRVVVSTKKQDGDTTASQREELSNQEWTRTSLSLSTKFPAKLYGLPATTASSKNLNVAEVESNRSGGGDRRTDLPQVTRALPDTPAARQLIEQLGAQESAAAAEAATIRQLQANGQAERNQQPIAEHQRKLKHLLSTAFGLKLQLEELQVKELQSRLHRLERQFGQRKELREKIIARRAGELIEGETLKWSPSAPMITRETEGGVSERGSLLGMTPTSRQPSGAAVTSPPPAGMGTRGPNPPGSMLQTAVPPKGLEFLSQYPRFSGLSLDMTEAQFRGFLEEQKLAPQLSIPRDGQLNYSVPLGDGNRLTVMFGLDGKCRGIEPISGDKSSTSSSPLADPAAAFRDRPATKIFPLEFVKAENLAKAVQALLGDETSSPRMSVDAATNSLTVIAHQDDMRVIDAIVIRLDKAPDPPSPKAAPQPGSDSSATPAIPGTSNASRPKADQIVIDLYGAP